MTKKHINDINEGAFGKLPIIMEEKADDNKTYIMRKNILTENRLNRIVENAVKQVLREDAASGNYPPTNPLLASVSRIFDSLYQRLYGNPTSQTWNQGERSQMPSASQKEGVGKHTVSDLIKSGTASRRGIDNTPPPEVQKNLQALLDNVLNPIAAKYPTPYAINSGYRSPALNAAVGGVKNSQHMKGQAADITCGSPAANKKLFDWIVNQSGINYDQIIDEKGYRWIHISFNPSGCRKKVTHL